MHFTYAHRHTDTHTHTHTHVHAQMQTKTHEQPCTGVKLTEAVGGSLFQPVNGSSPTDQAHQLKVGVWPPRGVDREQRLPVYTVGLQPLCTVQHKGGTSMTYGDAVEAHCCINI